MILLVAALFGLVWGLNVAHFRSIRRHATKLRARVVSHRWEKGPMRNDYTKLHYAYVVLDEHPDLGPRKLRYADNGRSRFALGDEVDVFFHDGELLYWDTH